jgi:uncharacterized membrane protein YagU involved in acid resistance
MPLHRRTTLLIATGGAIAFVGVVVFLAAHAIATPAAGVVYNPAERDLHETLWAAFGMIVWIGGIIIAAVGLSAWCRDGA